MITEHRNRKGIVFHEEDGAIIAKACAKCDEIKALDDYPKHKAGLGGRGSSCKRCRAGYYEENKSDYVERYEDNKEHRQELMRAYYASNKESFAEYQRKYTAENREAISERQRAYYASNKERVAEMCRNWRRNNPEKDILISERRRARKKSLPDDFTESQMIETLDLFGGCALTGEVSDLHWDHAVPLATGHGGTTFGNMIPLRGDLNLSKSDGNIFEWFERNKQRLNLEQGRFDLLIEWLASVNGMATDEYRSFVDECFENKRKEAI
jgi:hypothetical protein